MPLNSLHAKFAYIQNLCNSLLIKFYIKLQHIKENREKQGQRVRCEGRIEVTHWFSDK